MKFGVQHNPNERVISTPSQIAINIDSMIILLSDPLLHHISSSDGGWRLKRQLIDRQGCPGNTNKADQTDGKCLQTLHQHR